jgi:hypothetical protein
VISYAVFGRSWSCCLIAEYLLVKHDSIGAHLTIVFAALAVSRWIEAQTGWSIRKFVKTARRYHTIQIQARRQTITAADPFPDDLRQALETITRSSRAVH